MMSGSSCVRHARPYITKNAGSPTMSFVRFTAVGHGTVPRWVAPGVTKSIYMMTA